MEAPQVGDSTRLSNDFKDVDGVLTDPTTIVLKVKDPSGTTDVYTYASAQVERDATGQYHRDIAIDEPGTWHWRWEGAGAIVAVDEDFFYVTRSAF